MTLARPLIGAFAVLVFASAAQAQGAAPAPLPPPSFTTEITSASGAKIGTAVLTEGPSGVLMRVELSGLEPGWHGMHFHEKGDCSDPKFMSTGGHIQMAGMKMPHGLLNPGGPDFGDLPNLYVGPDGAAKAEVFAPLVSLKGARGRATLMDADGSALVIHAKPDDQTTQPIGGAGPRVACAMIK